MDLAGAECGCWDQSVMELKEVFWTVIPQKIPQHLHIIKTWVSFAKVSIQSCVSLFVTTMWCPKIHVVFKMCTVYRSLGNFQVRKFSHAKVLY